MLENLENSDLSKFYRTFANQSDTYTRNLKNLNISLIKLNIHGCQMF